VGGVAIIDPEGIFNGDRLRRCSNAAQLHWPRLLLASNGFARLEISYERIIAAAYNGFNPIPTAGELGVYIREYVENYLLFLYTVDGQLWGQWDTRKNLLPRYKTSADHRSPAPPETEFHEWKQTYLEQRKVLPKSFVNVSKTFLHGVGVGEGVGVGKNTCASPNRNSRVSDVSAPASPLETTEAGDVFAETKSKPDKSTRKASVLSPQQRQWFAEWWGLYWRHKSKQPAEQVFARAITTPELFEKLIAATRALTPEMCRRAEEHRPYGSTWLDRRGWEDEPESSISPSAAVERVPTVVENAECRRQDEALARTLPDPFAGLTGRRPS
jgi:hypothetical protein